MIDYRALLQKIMLMEHNLYGECPTADCVKDDTTSSVEFSDEEKVEVAAIASDAYTDWLVRLSPPSEEEITAIRGEVAEAKSEVEHV